MEQRMEQLVANGHAQYINGKLRKAATVYIVEYMTSRGDTGVIFKIRWKPVLRGSRSK